MKNYGDRRYISQSDFLVFSDALEIIAWLQDTKTHKEEKKEREKTK